MTAEVTPFGLQSDVQRHSAMTAPVTLSAGREQSGEGHVSRVNRLLHRGRLPPEMGRRPERNRNRLLRGHRSAGDAVFYHL